MKLVKDEFHSDHGILLLGAVEMTIKQGTILSEPWIGFLHVVPRKMNTFYGLNALLKDPVWNENLQFCKGLYVLSNTSKNYLEQKGVSVPINRILYPTDFNVPQFNMEAFLASKQKQLIFVGQYQRNYQTFFELHAQGFQKVLIRNETFDYAQTAVNDSVKIIDPVSDSSYDCMLTHSVVFQHLIAAAANTIVVECIARATPLLINKLEGVVEYLGEDYPFYFETLEEAQKKLKNFCLIQETSNYLQDPQIREKFTTSSFISAITNSTVFQSLPKSETH